MKITASFALCFTLLSSTAFASPILKRGDTMEMFHRQTPDKILMNYVERYNVPGIQLAIVQAPYIPRNVGLGLSNLSTKQLYGTNTAAPIGQITEGFTSIATMQLVEQGKIKLSDKISEFVSGLPQAWQNFTVAQLLAETTGIADYTKMSDFTPTKQYTPKQLLALVYNKPLAFKAGTQAAQSATNFVLLGLLIEKASGMSYENFVTKYQIKPLDLKNTYFMNKPPKFYKFNALFKKYRKYINPQEVAQGYNMNHKPVKPINASAYFANGSLVSDAHDISIWDVGLAGSILLKKASSRNFLFNPVRLSSGQMSPYHGHFQFPGHNGLNYIKGYAPGYSALLDRFTNPHELVCVTLVANEGHLPGLAVLARKIAAAYQTNLQTAESPWYNTVRQSPYSVKLTTQRIVSLVKHSGGHVFASIDQSNAAHHVNLKLSPTSVILFGNPKVGTGLMQKQPNFSPALPLKATVWKGENGQVWVSYPDLVELGKLYNATSNQKQLMKMDIALDNLMLKATSVY